MSLLPSTDVTALNASLGSSAPPVVNQAAVPAVVRNGSAAAKQAYRQGLEFEQVLVKQLAQELASTVSTPSAGDSSGGSDGDAGDGSGGLLGSGSATSAYESMIPDALTSAIMSAGGTGLALQLARAIDPTAFASQATGGSKR